MNKIYAYKYSEISGGLIAVSELTSRKTKKKNNDNCIIFCFIFRLCPCFTYGYY